MLVPLVFIRTIVRKNKINLLLGEPPVIQNSEALPRRLPATSLEALPRLLP